MIDERPDRNLTREIHDAAVVVGMEMRDEQVVDPRDARVASGGEDARGIPAVEPGVAGIDEQRIPRRRDEKRRLPALHIDEVDVERVPRHHQRSRRIRGEHEQRGDEHSPSILGLSRALRHGFS